MLGDELGAQRKAEFAAKEQKQCFRAIWRVAGSGKRRDETRGAPSRSHRMIASEGGAAGFCMAFL